MPCSHVYARLVRDTRSESRLAEEPVDFALKTSRRREHYCATFSNLICTMYLEHLHHRVTLSLPAHRSCGTLFSSSSSGSAPHRRLTSSPPLLHQLSSSLHPFLLHWQTALSDPARLPMVRNPSNPNLNCEAVMPSPPLRTFHITPGSPLFLPRCPSLHPRT
jgi:hypothetical protein